MFASAAYADDSELTIAKEHIAKDRTDFFKAWNIVTPPNRYCIKKSINFVDKKGDIYSKRQDFLILLLNLTLLNLFILKLGKNLTHQ